MGLVKKNSSSSSVLWWPAYATWGVISAVIGLVVVLFALAFLSGLSSFGTRGLQEPVLPTEEGLRGVIKSEGLRCFDGSASMKLADRIGETAVWAFDCPAGDHYLITLDGSGSVLSIRRR